MSRPAVYAVLFCFFVAYRAWGVTVQFDVSPTVGCVDISDEAFQVAFPGERLVEAKLHVSALVTHGSITEVAELLYDFTAPEQQIVVHDYLPKTTLASDVVGDVSVQNSDQASRRGQLSLGGKYQDYVHGSLSGGAEQGRTSSTSYQMLPPREMVSAAGTLLRGSGAYFKLKPSTQTSLEGSRDFVLLLRVPQNWRGDYLRATCRSRGPGGAAVGQASYLVPLYHRGDAIAKSLATQCSQHERQLLVMAAQYQKRIRRISRPTVAHEFSLIQPEIPADWLVRVLAARAESRPESFHAKLPPPLQSAVGDYRQSLQALTSLPPSPHELAAAEPPPSVKRVRRKPDDGNASADGSTSD